MGELTGMWKLIIYGRIDRNLEADYIWAICGSRLYMGEICGSRLYMDELTGMLTGMWKQEELSGMWKQIIYGRIDRNVEADYIWAN